MLEAKSLPARIKKYYPETQTADVTVCAEKVVNNVDELQAIRTWETVLQVPVHTASGGGFALTFPIIPGDTCHLIFSQVGYDHWFVEDKDTAGKLFGIPQPHLRRSWSLDDGFCYVGLNPLPRVITQVSPTDVVLRNKDLTSEVTIRDDGSINARKGTTNIEIQADGNIEINAPQTTINGNVVLNGNLSHVGNYSLFGNLSTLGQTVDITCSGGYTITGSVSISPPLGGPQTTPLSVSPAPWEHNA